MPHPYTVLSHTDYRLKVYMGLQKSNLSRNFQVADNRILKILLDFYFSSVKRLYKFVRDAEWCLEFGTFSMRFEPFWLQFWRVRKVGDHETFNLCVQDFNFDFWLRADGLSNHFFFFDMIFLKFNLLFEFYFRIFNLDDSFCAFKFTYSYCCR